MRVQFLGAAKQVGGSCQLFEVDDLKILIDVGLVQKNDIRSDMIFNTKEFTFNPKEIDYVILTHAHIDHIGLIPALVKAGYSGPILCTEPTMKISEISLKDCAFIWQREIEKALKSVEVRKGKIKLNNGTLCAPYSVEEAEMSMQFFRGYGFDKEIVLNDNVKFYFRNAGHILGAASIEFHIFENGKEKIVLFTGDISGKKDFHPFVKNVKYIDKADYVISEATYGNRKHSKTNIIEVLEEKVKKYCIGNKKTLLLATFSVQRTQELMYYFSKLYEKHPEFKNIKIYIDSPMGINVTKNVYRTSSEFFNDSDSKEYLLNILNNNTEEDGIFSFMESSAESMSLANGEPKIIISSAGMMSAGRIVNHVESFLPSKGCCIILTGYCAVGTFGRKLLDIIESGGKKINSIASGKELTVRADVYKLEGLSGHSDCNSTINYLKNIKGVKKIILNHGDIEAIDNLKNEIEKQMKKEVIVPSLNQIVKL